MSLKTDGFEIKGYNELMLNIENLGKAADKEVGKALRESAVIVQKELEKNTPKSLVDHPKHEHAKPNTKISNVKTNRDTGGKYITVGFPKEIKWRIHFVEFGTIRQKPTLFMTKTINNTQSAVMNSIIQQIKKGLNLK